MSFETMVTPKLNTSQWGQIDLFIAQDDCKTVPAREVTYSVSSTSSWILCSPWVLTKFLPHRVEGSFALIQHSTFHTLQSSYMHTMCYLVTICYGHQFVPMKEWRDEDTLHLKSNTPRGIFTHTHSHVQIHSVKQDLARKECITPVS